MNEELKKVVEQMLKEKNLDATPETRRILAYKLGDFIENIGKETRRNADCAQRAKVSYFDLEETFRKRKILGEELEKFVKDDEENAMARPANENVLPWDPKGNVGCAVKRPMELLRGEEDPPRRPPNVPPFLPPIPPAHTWKKTYMVPPRHDKTYVEAREINAENRLQMTKNLQNFQKRTRPTVSLFGEVSSSDKRFDLLDIEPPKRPAYMDALMGCGQYYGTGEDDDDEKISPEGWKFPHQVAEAATLLQCIPAPASAYLSCGSGTYICIVCAKDLSSSSSSSVTARMNRWTNGRGLIFCRQSIRRMLLLLLLLLLLPPLKSLHGIKGRTRLPPTPARNLLPCAMHF